MFSFHKPRVYRSTEGCCICRAKSSSSRFTDSKKYEDDSMRCFNLSQPRKGEICNACVLLVKRYKRLPIGSIRHWGHVVDARVGPGMKSASKFKKSRDEMSLNQQSMDGTVIEKLQKNNLSIPEKFSKIFRKSKKFDHINDNLLKGIHKAWEERSLRTPSESFNCDMKEKVQLKILRSRNNRRKILKPKKNISTKLQHISFFDKNLWQYLKTCCGIAYENIKISALIIDLQSYEPCSYHKNHNHLILPTYSSQVCQNTDIICVSHDVSNNMNKDIANLSENNAIPIFKKHLIFNRQQDNFPTGNLIASNNTTGAFACKITPNQFIKSKTSVIHKIKSDTAEKIIKHSINKINATNIFLKIKETGDINSFVNHLEHPNLLNLKKLTSNRINVQSKKNINLSATATKFSDNSSDSGFDENLLDRKSISPILEENKVNNNFLTRPVQKVFLASGVQIQGQHQNLMLTGNEVAAKVLKPKRQQNNLRNK